MTTAARTRDVYVCLCEGRACVRRYTLPAMASGCSSRAVVLPACMRAAGGSTQRKGRGRERSWPTQVRSLVPNCFDRDLALEASLTPTSHIA